MMPENAPGSAPGDATATGPGLREGPKPTQLPGLPRVRRPEGIAGSGSGLPGLLVVAGGVAVVIGTFLPWLQATGPGGTVTENGLKIGTWGTLILGVLATVRGLSLSRPGIFRAQLGSPLISGVLIAILVALRWNFLHEVIRNTEAASPGVTVAIGIGVWVVIAGAGIIIAGGLLSSQTRGR